MTVTLAFGGNLGSDGNTQIEGQGAGYVVTSEDRFGSGVDPVILHIYGDGGEVTAMVVNEDREAAEDGDDDVYFLYEGI